MRNRSFSGDGITDANASSAATFLAIGGARTDADVAAEARTIFTEIDRHAAVFSDLARLRLFYTSRDHFPLLHGVRQPFFSARLTEREFPAMTGVITGGRGDGAPLLEAEALLGAGGQAVYGDGVWRSVTGHAEPLPVSHGTALDGVMFVSGQVAYDGAAQVAGATLVDQLAAATTNLAAVVAARGATPASVVNLVVYVVEDVLEHLADGVAWFARWLAHWSPVVEPVVTWIGVRALFQPGLLVEVEAAVDVSDGALAVRSVPRTTDDPSPAAGGALAAAAGDWWFGSASVELLTAGDPAVSVAAALTELATGASALGASLHEVGLVTAWCSSPSQLAAVRAALDDELPGTAVTVVPLIQPFGAPPRLLLEAIGRGATASPPA